MVQEHWNFEVYDFLSWRLDGVNGANREQRRTARSQRTCLPAAGACDRACCMLSAKGFREPARDAVKCLVSL